MLLEKTHGNYKPLVYTLSALETCLKSVEPKALVQKALSANRAGVLTVQGVDGRRWRFDLNKVGSVYVVGAGKAAARMTEGVTTVLKNRIKEGAITIPRHQRLSTSIGNIKVTRASHPIPDIGGVRGTRRILGILSKARKNDLIFVLLSGGGSALLPLPAKGVSLADKKLVTKLLLESGANIHEINIIRKHLSEVKGGQLLRSIPQGCKVVSLILSDVVGDNLEAIASGPTVPDPSTYRDAYRIFKKYGLDKSTRIGSVINRIKDGMDGKVPETMKERDFSNSVHNVLIGTNSHACKALEDFFIRKKITAINMGSNFDGEARKMGKFLADNVLKHLDIPFVVIAGGETTVRLGSKNGKGGRNQEAVLSCAIELKKRNFRELDFAVACMGTDGIDGNSSSAGAIITPHSLQQADKLNLKMPTYLADHDSNYALRKLDSLIFTGYTGTNVNDVMIACRLR